jgi:hypothetical protein
MIKVTKTEYGTVYATNGVTGGGGIHTKKEWVGLTDEEIVEVLFELKTETMGVIKTERLARAVEAKLKEKNT